MANLFVSYARADQQIVQSLVSELRELGHEPFYDQNLTGGQRWWDVLLDRIQASEGFLPVLSVDYRKSEACHLEAEWAQKLQIPLLPIDLGQIGPELCASFIAESNWVRYNLDDRGSIARLARAISSVATPELPSPLPERPAIPISYLAATEREIRTSPALSIERQLVIIATLRGKLGTNEDSSARVLLRELRDRQDITYTNALDIDQLLRTATGADLTKSAAKPTTERAAEPAAKPAAASAPASAAPSAAAPAAKPAAAAAPAQPKPATPPQSTPPRPGNQPTGPQGYRPPTSPGLSSPTPPAYRAGAGAPPPTPQRPGGQRPGGQFPPQQTAQRPVPPFRPPEAVTTPAPRAGLAAVHPITWVLLGAAVLLTLISLFVADWISASGPGGSLGYDYGQMSSKVGTGDTGLSVVYFGWLGYILLVGVIVTSALAALLPVRKKALLWTVVGVSAVTLLLTIISMVGEVGRIDDKYGTNGVSGGYSAGFWLGLVAIVLFTVAPFMPRRRSAR